MQSIIDEVFTFWFGAKDSPDYGRNRSIWWQSSPEFDQDIIENFKPIYDEALEGMYDELQYTPEGILCLVILFDQFSRNMFRGSSRMYATDHKALELSKQAIAKGFDQQLNKVQQMFLYMPFQHSESLEDQEKSLVFYKTVTAETYEFAKAHYETVKKFGRFPHRNGILGRETTQEEADFLKSNPRGF